MGRPLGKTTSRGFLPAAPRGRRKLVAALVLLAVAVAVPVWLLARGDGTERSSPTRAASAGVSLPKLKAIAAAVPHRVYWAGAQPGRTYEFTRTSDDKIYIRYLPPGTTPGTARGDFLTVGTYPQENAFETLKATARTQRAETIPLPGGGLAFQDRNRPTSVYAAYPGSEYQVEVFEPSGGRALELVRAGELAPLVSPASQAASRAQLRTLTSALGHPLYWAGTRRDTTYELTRTRDGRVYVRYLPSGVRVGDSSAKYDTVATYPQRNAVANLAAAAAKLHATVFGLPGGGRAYIDTKRPTSAYLAYRGADLQVEVYTPDPARTERLVTSREIRPVG
jgi:hypothetical protein